MLGSDVATAVGGNKDATVHDLISGGADFNHIPKADHKNVVPLVLKSQHLRPAFDILGTCRLQYMEIGLETKYYEELYYYATGKKMDFDRDLLKLSEKIWHLNRMFNKREIPDFGRKYDYPPARFTEEPVPSGPNKGHLVTMEVVEEMLSAYYAARGWDENGIPTRETLAAHNLDI